MINARKPLIDDDGEVRELVAEDLREFRHAAEVLPPDLHSGLLAMNREAKLRGRPKANVIKERITIRLSPEVVQSFRATGDGWQTRVDAALKDWLKTHSPA
ncbi:BrnA antitoxin family protein [Azonexus sp.]|uniref:BrnA antitoxin family protein n=1 Tax=Azonexus sp. TaxID=1872668 RepID=UPI0039E4145D